MESEIRSYGTSKTVLRKIRELGRGPIARASAVSLIIRVAGLSLSFAQAVLTARLLGPSGYGIVAVAMAVVSIIGTVCMFGFGPLAVREIPARLAASDTAGAAAFLRNAVVVVLILSLTAGAALALVASTTDWIQPTYRETLLLGALLIVPSGLMGLFYGTAQGFGRVALAQVPSEIVRPAVMVLLMAAAAWLGQRFAPADYMWSVLAAVLLATTLTGAWLWRSELASLAPLHNMGNTRAQFAAALPFLGIALTSILQGEISTLLLGWFAGPREAGLFQPIVRMAPLIMLPVQAAGMRYAPRMAEFWRRGEIDRIRSVTTTFTLTTSLLTAGIALSLAASGPWIMWIFGPEFQQSAPLLWYIAAAQVFNAACGPVGMLLTMSGRSGGALNGHLAGLAVNVALGALLIPAHGAWGAIVGMVAGIVVWNLTMLGITRSHCGFDPSLAGVVVRSQRRN